MEALRALERRVLVFVGWLEVSESEPEESDSDSECSEDEELFNRSTISLE